ncbi:MAG: hydroxymethylbilane synthase [Actinobacteria bacterium]|nr:hydroxymethylbilane synthase [Actinomycetota bacterium]
MDKIVIGSRGSQLALWQTNFVADLIRGLGFLKTVPEIEIKKIKTSGDKILDVPLAKIGDKGLFVKELEVALINKEIDLAIHSMKDVPTELPEDLTIGAVLKREDQRDVLISKNKITLNDLPERAKIGTSSLRRRAQLSHIRPDFEIFDLRGNLDTRLKKLDTGELDGIILAAAGILRLGWGERITERISKNICLPAVGQGAIGIEIRKDDERIREIVEGLNHYETQLCVFAERALLKTLEGGCQVPIGTYSEVKDGLLRLEAVIGSLDGKELIRDSIAGVVSGLEEVEKLGIELADKLLADGGDKILEEIRLGSN